MSLDNEIDPGPGGGGSGPPPAEQTSAVEDPNSPEAAAASMAAQPPAPPVWQDPASLAPVEDTFNLPENDPFAPLPGMGDPQYGDPGYSPSLFGIPPDELLPGPNGTTLGRWGDNVMPYYGPPPPADYFGAPDQNEIRNAQRLQAALAKFQPAYRTSAIEDQNSPEYAAANPGTYTWEQARADSAARGQKANMPAGWNFYPEVAPTYGDIPEFANAIRDNMPHIPADVLANHPQLAQAMHDAIAAALRAPVTPHDYEQWVVGRMNSLDAFKDTGTDAVTQAIRGIKEAAGAPLGAVVGGIQSAGESGLGLLGLTMQAAIAQEPTTRDFLDNPIGSTVSTVLRSVAGLHPGETYKSLVWAAQRRQSLLDEAGNPTDPISLARIDGQVAGEVWRGVGAAGHPNAATGLVEPVVGAKGVAEFLNPAWLALGPIGKGAGALARIAPGGARIAPIIESYIANAGLPGADHVIGAAFRAGFDRAKVANGALRDFFNNNHFAQDERGASFSPDAIAGKIQGGIDVARSDAKALGPYWDYHMGRPGATTVREQSLTARGNHYGFAARPGEGQLARDDRIAAEYGYTHQGRYITDSQGNRVFEGRTAAETEAELHKIATTGYTTAETPPAPRFLSEDTGSGRLDLGMGGADHNPGVVSQVTDTARGITDPSQTYTSNYKLVEADDLILSHTPSGVPNPAYPEGVQPRARERVASQAQVDNIAANLEPDLLLSGGALDRGTPIVAPDSNVVLSGNGRGGAVLRAMTNYTPKYDAYRAALELKAKELGFPDSAVSSMQRPVLVRQLQGEHDLAQFAGEANYRTSLALSPAETAINDAGRLNDGILRSLRIGENQTIDQALLSSENDHVRSAILSAIPETERAALADADGRLNRDGLERIKSAIFAKTFPGGAGQAILERFRESLDPGMKNIEAAIFRSLPQVAKSEAMVRAGDRPRELGIGDDLASAITQLSRLKQTEGAHIPTEIAQMRSPSLFAGTAQLGDEQARLLEILHTLENKPRQLTDFLNAYSRGVERSSQMLMTGGTDTKASLMEQAFAAAAPNAPVQQGLGELGRPSLGVENKAAAPDQNGDFLIGDKVNLKSPGGRKTEPGTISEIIAPKSAMEPGRIVVTYDKGGSYVLPDTPANRGRLTKITGETPQQELATAPAAPAGPREVLAGADQRRSELVGPDPENPAYAIVKPLDGAQAGTEQRVHYSYLSEPARSEFAQRLKELAPPQKPWEVTGERPSRGWMEHVQPATGSEDDLVRELGVGRQAIVGHDTAAVERVVALERGIDQIRLAKADARGLEVHGGADGWYYVTKKGETPNYERKNANYAGPVLDKGQAIDYAAYGNFKPGPDLEGFGFRPFEGRAVPGTPLAEDVRKAAIASRQAEQVARGNLQATLKTDAEKAIFRATTGTEGDFAGWQRGKTTGMTDEEIKARLALLGQGGGTLEGVPGGYGYNKGTVFVGGSSKGPGVVAVSGNKLVAEVRRIYQIPTPDEVAKATGGPGAPPSAGVTTPPSSTPGGKGQGGAPSVEVHGGYEIRQAPKGGWIGVVPGDVNKNAPFRAKSREELISDIDAKAARTAARDAAQAKQVPKLERPAQTFTLPSGEKGTVTGTVTPDQTVEATMANGGIRRVPAKYAEAPKVTFATGMRQATQAKSFDLAAVNFVDAWKNAKTPEEMTTAADALARHYGFETLGEAQRALRPAKLPASEQQRLAFLLRDVPQEVRTVWRNSAKVATVTPPPSAKKGAEPIPTPQEVADVFGDVGVAHRAALDQIPRETVDQVRRFLRTPEGKQLTPELAAETPELAAILSHALETVKAEATPDAVQEVARLLIEREKQRNQFIAKKAASRAPDGPPPAAPSWRPEQDPAGRWFLRNELTGELDKSLSLSSEVGAKAVADKRNAISAPLTEVGTSGPIPLFGRPVFGDVPTEPTAAAIAEQALSDVQAATEAHARGEITTAELQGVVDAAAEKYRINKALEAVPKQDFEAIAQRAEAQVKQAEDSIAARQRMSQTADPQATAQLKILRDKAERARKMADEAAQTPPGPPPSAAGGGGEGEPPRPPAPPGGENPPGMQGEPYPGGGGSGTPPEGYASWADYYKARDAEIAAKTPTVPTKDQIRTQRRQAQLEKDQAAAAEARARELEAEFRKQGLTTKADIKWAEANAWRNIARLKAEGLPHDLTDELFVAAHRMNYDDLKALVQDYNKLSARLARGAGSSFDTAISILNLRKAVMASLDLSWGLRQGVMVSLNPFYAKTTAAGFKAGAHALFSGNYAEDLMASIQSHPLYDVVANKMGVDLTEWRNPAPLTKFEEEAQSHLAQYVPGINQSNRAFVAQANKVRMDLATNWIMAAERGGRTLTDTQYRNMGLWINSITGRGELGKFLSSSAPLLNALLFAPRFMASRVEAPILPLYFLARGDPRMALLATRDLALWFGTSVAILKLTELAGAKVEWDPKSNDFMKITEPRTGITIDPMGGYTQLPRLMWQIWNGERMDRNGHLVALDGQGTHGTPWEQLGKYFLGKGSPNLTSAYHAALALGAAHGAGGIVSGDHPKPATDIFNQDVTLENELNDLFPLGQADLINAIQADRNNGGIGIAGAAMGALSLFGAGVQVPTGEFTPVGIGSGLAGVENFAETRFRRGRLAPPTAPSGAGPSARPVPQATGRPAGFR